MDLSEFDIDFLSQKLSDNPQSPLFARLADLYLSKNQSSEALKICEAGVQTYPAYPTGYVVLGKCYLALNENSKARLAFSQAIHFAPFNQVARKLLQEIPASAEEPIAPVVEEPAAQVQPPVEEIAAPEPVAPEIVPQEHVLPQEEPLPQEAVSEPEPMLPPPVAEEPVQEHVVEAAPAVEEVPPAEAGPLPGVDEYIQERARLLANEKLISLDEYLGGATEAPKEPTTELDTLAEKLENAPRIVPPEPQPSPQDASPLDSTVITPTLAEIYASQGEYSAAIQAYEILILSKPDDRERFEQRIKELQAKLF
ncbi:MAG TPA: hypothetical protein VMM58_02175 [Bacteroidota bacterium]|nr:hypothetical protein [Bacteroidota bacterium]